MHGHRAVVESPHARTLDIERVDDLAADLEQALDERQAAREHGGQARECVVQPDDAVVVILLGDQRTRQRGVLIEELLARQLERALEEAAIFVGLVVRVIDRIEKLRERRSQRLVAQQAGNVAAQQMVAVTTHGY